MDRYNIFKRVHQGLRAILYETALRLQQTDFNSQETASDVLSELETVIALFEKHAHTEDNLVFAVLQHYEPALVENFENEHVEDHALAARLSGLIKMLTSTNEEGERIKLGVLLNQAFIHFMVFNLNHMASEEAVINPALWKNFSDDRLQGISREIMANTPANYLEQYSRWMMRGMNNGEIVQCLKEIKNNAPDPVFGSLLRTAEANLPNQRWQLIKESLTEGALLA